MEEQRVRTVEQIVKALENNDPIGDEVIWAGAQCRSLIEAGIMDPDQVVELWPDYGKVEGE